MPIPPPLPSNFIFTPSQQPFIPNAMPVPFVPTRLMNEDKMAQYDDTKSEVSEFTDIDVNEMRNPFSVFGSSDSMYGSLPVLDIDEE